MSADVMQELQGLRSELREVRTMLQDVMRKRRSKAWVSISEAARLAGMPRTTFERNFLDTGKVRSRLSGQGRKEVRRADAEALSDG